MIRHLLCPGLFGPAPEAAGPPPPLPRLEALLARADRLPGAAGFAEAAFRLFGVAHGTGCDLPTAALCYAYQTGSALDRWVLHADPVHLRADQDRLLLFDSATLAVRDDEALACEQAFNHYFADDGLRLHAVSAQHWYLLADAEPAIVTAPLDQVSGRDINAYLPDGPRRREWRRLLNEAQMLLHGLEFNTRREHAGEPAINGLWLSGAGRLPDRGATGLAVIGGENLLVSALARHADRSGDDALWVADDAWRALLRADAQGWYAALARIDAALQEHLTDADECWLHGCQGVSYRWRRSMRWRLWRRPRAFAKLLRDSA